jgi:hypothetical protein
MAVGQRTDGKLVAERWDGSRWSLEPVPGPPSPAGLDVLVGVACRPAFCIAVGDIEGATHLLIERWEGSRWSIQHTPTPAGGGVLFGVSCPSARACTAVGGKPTAKHTLTMLAERWNGTRWSIESTPSRAGYDQLVAVSCSSTRACTAVGENDGEKHGKKTTTTLAERRRG